MMRTVLVVGILMLGAVAVTPQVSAACVYTSPIIGVKPDECVPVLLNYVNNLIDDIQCFLDPRFC